MGNKFDPDEWVDRFITNGGTFHRMGHGRYFVEGSVAIESLPLNGKLPVKFEVVTGDFCIRHTPCISMDGFPSEIGGDLLAWYNKIQDVKGFPKLVGGEVDLEGNDITSLDGVKTEIVGPLVLNNNHFTTLAFNNTNIKCEQGVLMLDNQNRIANLLDVRGFDVPLITVNQGGRVLIISKNRDGKWALT